MQGDYPKYYECRTYDKNGKLIKIELRPPHYDVLETQEGFFGRRLSYGDGSKYNRDGTRKSNRPEI